jgi:hypothetical protein
MNSHAYVSLGMFSGFTLENALSILPPTLFVFFNGTCKENHGVNLIAHT